VMTFFVPAEMSLSGESGTIAHPATKSSDPVKTRHVQGNSSGLDRNDQFYDSNLYWKLYSSKVKIKPGANFSNVYMKRID
jgi:hypothetical protein